MIDRPTCGVLYRRALEHFTGMYPGRLVDFSRGFCAGQVEKCYLGACVASMFRPSPEHFNHVLEAVQWLCGLYDLDYMVLGEEVWIYRRDLVVVVIGPEFLGAHATLLLLDELRRTGQVNTPLWHNLRGQLCGVRDEEIDEHFHERPGYDEPADLAPSATDGVASNAMTTIDMSWTGGRAVAQCARCLQDMPDGHFEMHEGIGLCPACAAEIAPSRDP